ncbi:thrombospondin type 3 repeat-containing protein [Pontibacter anaerobius]|uniref:Thrombospondin type 3 repeat-containing protein n=1 Tax=Pontibacter anaerobius TaxID=2993940 RepID=A0ABT3RH51_9BACT|nr:thrombospondin type 3 repeat-containing protein [Pontibacter anaerobius]MCX2741110.1 thrombospondin type 3 repeat-containing protein [Pontibacter anaerobius]
MNRKPYYLLILFSLLLLYPWDTLAQQQQYRFKRNSKSSNVLERGWVILLGGGVTAVRSDICGSWGCNDFGPNVSVGGLYKFSPYLGVSGTIDYVKLGASDKDRRSQLNLAFESQVIEVTGSVLLNLLDSYAGSGNYRSKRKRFVVPYVRLGAGFVYYNPVSFPRDRSLDESQVTYDPERKYPAIAPVVPLGGGLRFYINDEISIASEIVYRVTNTDYLDNVGPRQGNPTTKDQYGVVAIKLQYTPVLKNKIFSKKP